LPHLPQPSRQAFGSLPLTFEHLFGLFGPLA
jgi:hypothetical protein